MCQQKTNKYKAQGASRTHLLAKVPILVNRIRFYTNFKNTKHFFEKLKQDLRRYMETIIFIYLRHLYFTTIGLLQNQQPLLYFLHIQCQP